MKYEEMASSLIIPLWSKSLYDREIKELIKI